MRPYRLPPKSSNRTYVTFLAIVGFSVGLLAGYAFLGHPHSGTSLRRSVQQQDNSSTGGRKEAAGVTVTLPVAATRVTVPTGDEPKASPPAGIAPVAAAVAVSDERHPKNIDEVISGQSSSDEHRSDQLTAMKQQNSDKNEHQALVDDAAISEAQGTVAAALDATAAAASSAVAGASKAATTAATTVKAAAKTVAAKVAGSSSATTAASDNSKRVSGGKATTAAGSATTAKGAADADSTAGLEPQATMLQAQAETKVAAADTSTKQEAVTASKGADTGKGAGTASNSGAGGQGSGTAGSSGSSSRVVADGGVKVAVAGAAGTGVSTGSKAVVSTAADAPGRPEGHTVHTLFTSNGSPYQNFQARIMVGTYNLVRKMPGSDHLVALTRILHRTTPDEVMEEIPTFLAQPLQPECDKWCWFPVADRANAVQQWLDASEKDPSMVKGAWLLLLETDYVWIKPLPRPGNAWDPSVPGWSFGFDYIGPKHPVVRQLLLEKCPECDIESVPNSGPAPVLLRFADLKVATPIWEDLSKWIETHEKEKKALGWVREMYAWDISIAVNKINMLNQGPPDSPLISQPPHDLRVGNASMYHYTWGSIFKVDGKETWKFDKRAYTAADDALKVPKLPLPPPWREGILLHDGNVITEELQATLTDMLTHMNAAIDTLPDLRPGHGAKARVAVADAASTTAAA